jgi:hypothetical protein
MSSNPISNLNSRQDDVFSLDDNNKPGIRAHKRLTIQAFHCTMQVRSLLLTIWKMLF